MEINPQLTPLTRFGLGEALLKIGKYQEAIPHLEQYKQGRISEKSKQLVEKYLADCDFALHHNEIAPIHLRRLPATINSAIYEYFQNLSADKAQNIITSI